MDTKPQLIVKGRKFEQVLEGARAIFMRDGFDRALMDDIAREAGVSKATLYAYFPDKRILFMEIATAECRRQAEEAISEINFSMAIPDGLRTAATRIIGLMQSDLGKRIYRIAVTESENFPELAQEFYKSGPLLVRDCIGDYLRKGVERGELEIDDIALAAAQFGQLCKVELQDRLLFTGCTACPPDEVQRIIDGAIAMFMARYAKAK